MGEAVNLRDALGDFFPAESARVIADTAGGFYDGRLTTEQAVARLSRLPAGAGPLAAGSVAFEQQDMRGELIVPPGAPARPGPAAPSVLAVHATDGSEVSRVTMNLFQGVLIRIEPRTVPDTPTAPRPRTSSLIGRDALRDALVGGLLADGGPAVAACWGAPCTGKTDLVRSLAWDARIRGHFTGGVLYAELGGVSRAIDVLAGWCRQLDLARDEQAPLEAAAGLVRNRLAGTRTLVVVDDVWPEDQGVAAMLLSCVPEGCRTLLSSRGLDTARDFADDGTALFEVPPVNIDARLGILRLHAERVVAAEPEACAALAEALGGLAGAVSFAGRLLAADRMSDHPARELLDTWRTRLRELRGVTVHPALPSGNPASLEALIRLGYDRLPPDVRRGAAQLAVFGPVPRDFDNRALRAVWGQAPESPDEDDHPDWWFPWRGTFPEPTPLDLDTARAWERAVVGHGLVEYDDSRRRYRIHQVVHAFLTTEGPGPEAYEKYAGHYEALLRRSVEAYAEGGVRAAAAVHEVDQDFGQIERLNEHAKDQWRVSRRWLWLLTDIPGLVGDYCDWRRRHADLGDWSRTAAEVAEESGMPADRRLDLYMSLARAAAKTGRAEEGLWCLDRITELDPERMGPVELRYQRALFRRIRGETEGVVEAYEAYVAEARETMSVPEMLNHLCNLSNAYRDTGRREDAADVLAGAVDLVRGLDTAGLPLDRIEAVQRVCENYADDCELLGRPERAQEVRDFARSAFPYLRDSIIRATIDTDYWLYIHGTDMGAIVDRGAVDELVQAAGVARRHRELAVELRALSGVAESLDFRGRAREALPYARRVLTVLDLPTMTEANGDDVLDPYRTPMLGVVAGALYVLRRDTDEYRSTLRAWAEAAHRMGDTDTVVHARGVLTMFAWERRDLTAAVAAWRTLRAVADEAPGDPEDRRTSQAGVAVIGAYVALIRADLEQCREELAAAERLAPSGFPHRAEISRLRIWLLGMEGRRDEARTVLEDLRAAGDEAAGRDALRAMAFCHIAVGDEAAAAACLREAARLHEEAARQHATGGDSGTSDTPDTSDLARLEAEAATLDAAVTRGDLVILQHERPEWTPDTERQAADALRSLTVAASRPLWDDERSGARPWYETCGPRLAQAPLIGALTAMAGDVPAGERILRGALPVFAREGSRADQLSTVVRLGWVLRHSGRAAEARALVRQQTGEGTGPVPPGYRHQLALLLAHCGEDDDATDTATDALREERMEAPELATATAVTLVPALRRLNGDGGPAGTDDPAARLWHWLRTRHGQDAELMGLVQVLTANAASAWGRNGFQDRLTQLLEDDEQGREELSRLLPKDVVMRVSVRNHSTAKRVQLLSDGNSEQSVDVDGDSSAEDIVQDVRRER